MARPPVPSKPCARCGRTITWRKVWARDGDSVRRCSDNCHKHGLGDVDRSELIKPARTAAQPLVATGRAEVTPGGQVIDPSRFRGPIRVRRPR